MKVHAGIQSGQALRLRGKGMPRLRETGRGDQIVRVLVWTPTNLSKEEKELFERCVKWNLQLPEPDVDEPGFWETGEAGVHRLISVVLSVLRQRTAGRISWIRSWWFCNQDTLHFGGSHVESARVRPDPAEYDPYYGRYVERVEQEDVLDALEEQWTKRSDSSTASSRRSASIDMQPGKWTVKQVVCHMLDTERIFGVRALLRRPRRYSTASRVRRECVRRGVRGGSPFDQ